jgi:dihydrolipoamide dehydrogenase
MAKSVTIIGGGLGGYVAAIRAAQLGAQVTLVEKDALGGTCLNRGCIPTKALLQSADLLEKIRHAETFGISVDKVSLDFSAVTKRKEAVVKRLVDGVAYLMRKNKIKVIKGTGVLIDSKTVGILGGNDRISSESIIIATGSKPSTVPIKGVDEAGVISSDEALVMNQLPQSMAIIGGGVIGLEFAQFMYKMGCKVTVIEMMPQILPAEDTEIAHILENILKKEGIEVFTSATVTNIENGRQGNKVFFTTKDGNKQDLTTDKVLLSVGRQPYTDGLGVNKVGLTTDKSRVVVNEHLMTNVPSIYAIGDVIGGFMLAHKAAEEGKCAAENALGARSKIDYRIIPRCVYTSPEVAGVGLTETLAKERYGNIKVGRFSFSANGRAVIQDETTGIVKIIADAKYGEILGIHIVGPQATELIAEAVLGMKLEATFEDIASTVHAHPTLSETLMEAALNVEGKSIQA